MVKEKQTRTYYQDGFRKRAACLCVRDPQESEILLVTSSRATDHWIVPGGGVEPNEDPSEAAIRETEEEAGVKGIIKRCLGNFEVRDENMSRKHRTSVFVLEVQEELDEWEDSKCRQRRWFPVEEALRLLAIYKPVQCTYVKLLIQTTLSCNQNVPSLSLQCTEPANNDSMGREHYSEHSHNSPLVSSTSPCKTSSELDSTTLPYLQVNHFPSSDSTSHNNAGFHTFICTREVYSTDSETTEEGNNGTNTPSNHCDNDNISSRDTSVGVQPAAYDS